MAYGSASSGASNPVGVDVISAIDYQLLKLLDATPGSINGLVIDANGRITVNIATDGGKTLLFAAVGAVGAGDNVIVAAVAAQKIKVVSYVLVADAAVAAEWKSGATTGLSGAMSLDANGGIALAGDVEAHLLETAVNQALILNLSAAVGVRGHIAYQSEA